MTVMVLAYPARTGSEGQERGDWVKSGYNEALLGCGCGEGDIRAFYYLT